MVAFLLEAHELCVRSFPSAGEFLAAVPSLAPGCVLTDMCMPGMDGLELLRDMRGRNLPWPVVVMTAHGEVTSPSGAQGRGKRFDRKAVSRRCFNNDAVLSALRTIDQTSKQDADVAEINGRIATLTPREREVLEQLVAGNQNKMIAYNLGISPRTVEVHRARVMDKMHARSLSALVRMAVAAGVHPAA